MSARKRRIVYSDDARTELSNILLYTEDQWGKSQRATYRRLILDTLRRLAQSPSLGRSRDDLSVGMRSYPVGSHVLNYWERDGVLTVAHILYARRDASKYTWFGPLDDDTSIT